MQTVTVDLILHSLHALLLEHPGDEAPGIYATGIGLCIDRGRLAEEWPGYDQDYEVAWLMRRLDPETLAPINGNVSAKTHTIEVAVARRLADTAFALTIEQDAEAARTAATLLRAAQAIVGLAAAPARAVEECSEERARMAVEMAANLAARADIVAGGVTVAAKNGVVTMTSPPPKATPLVVNVSTPDSNAIAEVAQALGLAADMAPAAVIAHAAKFREQYTHATVEMAAAHRRLAETAKVCEDALETDATYCDHPQCTVARLRDILRPAPGETTEEAARRMVARYTAAYTSEGTWRRIAEDYAKLLMHRRGRTEIA